MNKSTSKKNHPVDWQQLVYLMWDAFNHDRNVFELCNEKDVHWWGMCPRKGKGFGFYKSSSKRTLPMRVRKRGRSERVYKGMLVHIFINLRWKFCLALKAYTFYVQLKPITSGNFFFFTINGLPLSPIPPHSSLECLTPLFETIPIFLSTVWSNCTHPPIQSPAIMFVFTCLRVQTCESKYDICLSVSHVYITWGNADEFPQCCYKCQIPCTFTTE